MPRKGPIAKRPVVQDPVYGSPVVSQLVNKILLDGKKSIAEKIVYGALEGTNAKTGDDPVVLLKKALDNVRPTVEVRSRRVGGSTYQVPIEVKSHRLTRWPRLTRHSHTTAGNPAPLPEPKNLVGSSNIPLVNKKFRRQPWHKTCSPT